MLNIYKINFFNRINFRDKFNELIILLLFFLLLQKERIDGYVISKVCFN
jgi:hypothetical protein